MFAKFDWLLAIVLIGLCFCLHTNADEEDENDIHLERQDSCSFYCFMLPKKKDLGESIQKSINALKDLNCTHLVYGYATINHYQRIQTPNKHDLELNAYWGNYRRLHELHKAPHSKKLLLAVREELGVHFIDSSSTRRNVTKNLVMHAEYNYFDGLFLNLHDTYLNSFYFEQFVHELRQEIEERVERFGKSRMLLVLALNAHDAFYTSRKVKLYADKFDAFYLKGDEPLTAESDVTTAVSLDPIYTDKYTPFEDVISEMAKSLIQNGIPNEKLVIGLSANARGYNLASRNETTPGSFVYEYARLNNSQSTDGRFAYQEICQLPGADKIEYWEKSVAVSFVDGDDNWFSLNLPGHESMERKVKYILSHGYAGIGVSHLEADDPNDECGKGSYPLNKFVSQRLQCSKQLSQHGGTTECKRMCIYRPERAQISFQHFKAEWCSHFVISSVDFNATGSITEPAFVKEAVVSYNTWSARKKPYLVLSIGAEMTTDTWHRVLDEKRRRKLLIDGIWQLYKDMNVDGVSIDFVKEPIVANSKDKDGIKNFSTFLEELNKAKPKKAVIFLTVSFVSTLQNEYDFVHINKTVDYVILEGYKFHQFNDHFTGHHSPLFGNNTQMPGNHWSIEAMAAMWTKVGVPHNRIILGFSAAGITMNIVEKEDSPSLNVGRLHERKYLGLKIDHSDVRADRSKGPGLISQTELCEELQKGKATHQLIHDLGVPVARSDNVFYAYDDERSIQTKAIWASLNHFAGVSLHAIEFDNPESICPSKEPFNLLQKIVHTQACEACANPNRTVDDFLTDTDTCQPEAFRIICNYELPKVEVNDNSFLTPELIPFERCSEVVVEEILWMSSGHLTFRNQHEEQNLIKLTEYLTMRPELKKKLYLIVRCHMTTAELKPLLEHKNVSIGTILEQLDRLSFNGIELRCDDALTNETKPLFQEFVNGLSKSFEQRKEERGHVCAETVSIRIPIWNRNLTEKYEIEQLNSVHQVVLETFELKSNRARVISPLYGFDKSNETHSIDASIGNWLQTGVQRQKIIMQVPSYGLVQTFKTPNAHHKLNDTTEEYFNFVSQPALCYMFNKPGPTVYQQHILYDMVSAYALSNNKWLSYETSETIIYKTKFAIREGLGGIGLLTLNQEDFHANCGSRNFGLLNAIHASICPAPLN